MLIDRQIKTPEQIRRQRAMAEQLLKQGGNVETVDSPLELIGSLLQSGAGALGQARANRDEKAGLKLRSDAQMKMADRFFDSASGAAVGAGAGFGSATGPITDASPTPSGSGVAASDLKPYQAALLDTISGPESAGAYDVIYGGSKFADFSDHPRKAVPIGNGPNEGKTSSAAGRYQFLGSTWDQYAGKLGLQDFSPANQDRAAYALAADTYKQKTGQDLDAVLQSGDPDAIASVGNALSGVWTSLPGGIEQGTNTNRFVSAFQGGLGRYGSRSTPNAPVEVASLDPAAGVAEATRPPATAREAVERAAAAQGFSPDGGAILAPPGSMSPEDQAIYDQRIRGQGAQPNPTNMTPYTGPGARMDDPSAMLAGGAAGDAAAAQTAALRGANPASPMQSQAMPLVPGSGGPSPTEASRQALASGLMAPASGTSGQADPWQGMRMADASSASSPSAAPSTQMMGAMLTGGQQPQPPRSPYDRALIAELMGNPWTEDLGQGMLQQALADQQKRQQAGYEYQLDQRKTADQRRYDQMTKAEQRAYDDRVRQQGFQREDQVYGRNREDENSDYLRRKQIDQGFQAPPSDVQEYNFYADQERAAGREPVNYLDFQTAQRRAGASSVTVGGGNTTKFSEKSDEAAAKRLDDIVQAGGTAVQTLGDVQQLAELGKQIGTGLGAQVMTRLGPYAEAFGIDVEGLAPAQAYQSIIARMAPQMRPAGSGASSDFDARQFLQGLPSLGNTPEGNQIITDTFGAVQQNKMQAAEIASMAYLPPEQGGITWQEAERQIRSLPNPYERYRAYRDRVTGAPQGSPQTGAPAGAMPATGASGQRYEDGVPVGGAAPAPVAPPPGNYRWNPAAGRMEAM